MYIRNRKKVEKASHQTTLWAFGFGDLGPDDAVVLHVNSVLSDALIDFIKQILHAMVQALKRNSSRRWLGRALFG